MPGRRGAVRGDVATANLVAALGAHPHGCSWAKDRDGSRSVTLPNNPANFFMFFLLLGHNACDA